MQTRLTVENNCFLLLRKGPYPKAKLFRVSVDYTTFTAVSIRGTDYEQQEVRWSDRELSQRSVLIQEPV